MHIFKQWLYTRLLNACLLIDVFQTVQSDRLPVIPNLGNKQNIEEFKHYCMLSSLWRQVVEAETCI